MKIVIVSPVEHDGKTLDVGEVADLPKAQAEALVAAGAALEAGAKAKAAAADDKPQE